MSARPAMGAARVVERLKALGAVSDSADGLTRLTLSPAHRRAVDLVGGWMREAGLATRVDGAATLVGRREGRAPNARTLLLGSHIDSVRNGGNYDGPLGVVLAIEALDRLRAQGVELPFAVEVLAFGDEEGVRFPTALTGSRAVAGCFDPAALDTVDDGGMTRRDALRAFGCDPDAIPAEARDPARTVGYLEVHIEQGPVLESRCLALGVVTAINGASRGEITLRGAAGHAGTLPMAMRRDAGTAAAEIVLAIESIGRGAEHRVATVGRIDIPNGAVNVVPGAARLSLDLRSPSDDDRAAALAEIERAIAQIALRRNVEAKLTISYDMPAAPCDPRLQGAFEAGLAKLGHAAYRLPSGAGHDAMAFRGRIPMAMLFVRCRGGVSHRPDEYASPEDIGLALAALESAIMHIGAEP